MLNTNKFLTETIQKRWGRKEGIWWGNKEQEITNLKNGMKNKLKEVEKGCRDSNKGGLAEKRHPEELDRY